MNSKCRIILPESVDGGMKPVRYRQRSIRTNSQELIARYQSNDECWWLAVSSQSISCVRCYAACHDSCHLPFAAADEACVSHWLDIDLLLLSNMQNVATPCLKNRKLSEVKSTMQKCWKSVYAYLQKITRSPAVAREGRPYWPSRKTVIPPGIGLAAVLGVGQLSWLVKFIAHGLTAYCPSTLYRATLTVINNACLVPTHVWHEPHQ